MAGASTTKSVIVTGASRGIGRAVATRLAHDGFAVVVNFAGNSTKAEEVVAEIKGAGGQAIAVQALRGLSACSTMSCVVVILP